MGLFNKLMFWKKKEPEIEDIPEEPEEREVPPAWGYGREPRESMQAPLMQQPQTTVMQQSLENKDLQIISSKIDALNAKLDAIDQRLINLERLAEQPEQRW